MSLSTSRKARDTRNIAFKRLSFGLQEKSVCVWGGGSVGVGELSVLISSRIIQSWMFNK